VDDRGLATRLLGHEPFFLAVEKHHPLAKKKRVAVSDLTDKKLLILQEGHCFRNQSLDYCKRTADGPDIVFQGSSLSSVMRLAAVGEGATFVPKMAATKREHPDLAFLRFANPEPSREVGLVWRMTTPLSPAQTLLIEVIDEILTAKLR
jgi:LysR family hydrogen peroxide-inducible transcriptional activator